MNYNYKRKRNSKIEKYIVFDVDETLGYFSQFGGFIDAVSFYYKDLSGSIFERFNEILDLYPEFIRPKIIEILKYIHKKKISGNCNGVFIYTNNQGPRIWVQHISKYFDYKVGNLQKNSKESILFDKIIGAYMVNGKIVEPKRTTQNKTYDDLLRITGISNKAEICFVDDLNHPQMRHDNVLYLNVKPYVKTLSVEEMIRRYLKSPLGETIISSQNALKFTNIIRERMGSIQKINENKLNLHDSNYIYLQTPFNSTSLKEDIEYKNSGQQLFSYVKLFLKKKQNTKQGIKYSLHTNSKTRRSKNHLSSSLLLSENKTKKIYTKKLNTLHKKYNNFNK